MRGIDGIEGKILKEYINGGYFKPKWKIYLDRMANTKLVSFGYDPETGRATVKTTALGRASIK